MRHAGGERCLELLLRFDLNDDGYARRRFLQGVAQRPAIAVTPLCEQRPVVVLPQDRVGERGAIPDATSNFHGVDLQRPQSRRRLSRVGDSRLRASHGVDGPPRQRRDAAQALQEIQRDAFPREQSASAPSHGYDRGAGIDP